MSGLMIFLKDCTMLVLKYIDTYLLASPNKLELLGLSDNLIWY